MYLCALSHIVWLCCLKVTSLLSHQPFAVWMNMLLNRPLADVRCCASSLSVRCNFYSSFICFKQRLTHVWWELFGVRFYTHIWKWPQSQLKHLGRSLYDITLEVYTLWRLSHVFPSAGHLRFVGLHQRREHKDPHVHNLHRMWSVSHLFSRHSAHVHRLWVSCPAHIPPFTPDSELINTWLHLKHLLWIDCRC